MKLRQGIAHNPQLSQTLADAHAAVHSVVFAVDSRSLAVSSRDGRAHVYYFVGDGALNLTRTIPDGAFRPRSNPGSSFAVAPDHNQLAWCSGEIYMNLCVFHISGDLNSHCSGIVTSESHHFRQFVTFSPNSKWIAAASEDGNVRLYLPDALEKAASSSMTMEPAYTLTDADDHVHALAFSFDSMWLASGGDDDKVRLYSLEGPGHPELVDTAYDGTNDIQAVAFAVDLKWLASGSADGKVRLYELATNKKLKLKYTLSGTSSSGIRTIKFSMDLKWFASGSSDNLIQLYGMKANRPPILEHIIDDAVGAILSIDFSLDSRWLASGSKDKKARIYDLRYVRTSIAQEDFGTTMKFALLLTLLFLAVKLHVFQKMQYLCSGIWPSCCGKATRKKKHSSECMIRNLATWTFSQKHRANESLSLGVCLNYLVDEFYIDVQAIPCLADASFYDLKEEFWLKLRRGEPAPDFHGSQLRICPRDQRRGCSIVDALHDTKSGRANVYLSWTWGIRIDEFASALKSWRIGHLENDTSEKYVWVCFFCNNQHRHIVEESLSGSDALQAQFYSRLLNIDRVLILMDSFRNPRYITRIWCVYELYVVVSNDVRAEVILPGRCETELLQDLNSSGGLTSIRNSLETLDVEKAEAYLVDDVRRIKSEISQSVGYTKVNTMARKYLKEWLTTEFARQLE